MKINKNVALRKKKDHVELEITNTDTKAFFTVSNNEERVIIRLSDTTLTKIISSFKGKPCRVKK